MAISKVGLGWAVGERDYTSLQTWEAAKYTSSEFEEAWCKGSITTTIINFNRGFPAGLLIRGDVVYTGNNENDLAFSNNRIILSVATGATAQDLKITEANIGRQAFGLEGANTLGLRIRALLTNTASGVNVGAFTANRGGVLRNCIGSVVGANIVTLSTTALGVATVEDCLFFSNGGAQGFSRNETAIHTIRNNFTFGSQRDYVVNGASSTTNCASQDATGNVTGYTSAELVNFEAGDYRIKSTSDLKALGIGAFFEEAAVGGVGELLESSLSSLSILTGNLNNKDLFSLNIASISNTTSNLLLPVYLASSLSGASNLNTNLKLSDNFALTLQSTSDVTVNLKSPVSLISNNNSESNLFGSITNTDAFLIGMYSSSNLLAQLTVVEAKFGAALLSTSSIDSNLTLSVNLSCSVLSLSSLNGDINQNPVTIEITGEPTINVFEQNNLIEALDDRPQVIVNLGTQGVQGLSAYQIALLNGFVGTEVQWLDSLKGERGLDGVGIKGDTGSKGDTGEVDPTWLNSVDELLVQLGQDLAWLDDLLIQVNLDLDLNKQKLAQLDLDLDNLNNVTLVRVNQELIQARADLENNRLALLGLQETLSQVNLDLAWLNEREAVRNQELNVLNIDLADLAITLITANENIAALNTDIQNIRDVNSNLDSVLQEFITTTNNTIDDLLLETETIKQDLKLEINKNTLSRKEADKLIFDTLNFATQLKNNQTNLTNALFEVDPATGTIRNLAYAYADNQFTQAGLLIDGVNAQVNIQAQRVNAAEDRITNAESQLTLQAGEINLRATYTDVTQIVSGAIEAIQPAYSFGFFSSAEGWVAVNGTLTTSSGQLDLTLGDIQNTQINYNGFENPVITLNIERTGGTNWVGNLIVSFSDATTETYTNVIEDVAQGSALIRILNLAGDASYTGTEANPKTITGLRFVFGSSVTDTFVVKTITIGKPSALLQELDGLQVQVNDLGIELDAFNATLTNYVTVSKFNNEAVTLSNVSTVLDGVSSYAAIQATLQEFDNNDTLTKANYAAIWVDAANSNIRQQVQNYKLTDIDPELDLIRGDLTTASSKIDAVNGTISNQIVSISGLKNREQDLGKIALEAEYLFYQAKKKQLDTDVAVSFAFNEIEATTTAQSALAQNVLLLSAQLGTAEGTLVAEVDRLDRAIVDESTARADSINNLSVSITEELEAQSTLIQSVKTTADGNTSSLAALDTRIEAGEDFAQAQVSLNTGYDNNLNTLTARAFLGTSTLGAGETKYTITGLTVDSVQRGIRFQGDLFELVNGAGLRRLYWQTDSNEWQIDGNVLVSGSIRGDALVANTITGDKIAANAISADKIVANSISSDKIVANAITSDKISANAIDATKIVANSITGDKIQANTISGDRLLVNTINNDRLISNSITADKLVALSITGNEIAANAISGDKLIANTIGAREIVAKSIDASKIVSQTITGDLIAANTIGADKIIANSIGAREIVAFSITADKLQANSITTDKLAINSVTADKIAAGSITADKITAGTITGDKIIANVSLTSPVINGGEVIIAKSNVAYMSIIRAEPFGSSNDLVEWYGPKTDGVTWNNTTASPIYAGMSKANAKTYKTVNGSVYFGGTFRAGVISNSQSSTQVTNLPNTQMTFGSNGNLIELTASVSYADTELDFNNSICPVPAPAAPSLTLYIERLISGNWVIVSQVTTNGSYECIAGQTGAGEPRTITRNVGVSVNYTDSNLSTANRTYRARATINNHYVGANTTQSITLVSAED